MIKLMYRNNKLNKMTKKIKKKRKNKVVKVNIQKMMILMKKK